LAAHEVRLDSQPFQVGLDRVGVFRLRTFEIGVIEAKDERAPRRLANSQLSSAVRALPMWMRPVGEGAKRTTGGEAISPS
jgi:hypothetical protein